jgi:hypothetical protein
MKFGDTGWGRGVYAIPAYPTGESLAKEDVCIAAVGLVAVGATPGFRFFRVLPQTDLAVTIVAEAVAFADEEIGFCRAVGIMTYRTLADPYRPMNPIALIHGRVTLIAEFALFAS